MPARHSLIYWLHLSQRPRIRWKELAGASIRGLVSRGDLDLVECVEHVELCDSDPRQSVHLRCKTCKYGIKPAPAAGPTGGTPTRPDQGLPTPPRRRRAPKPPWAQKMCYPSTSSTRTCTTRSTRPWSTRCRKRRYGRPSTRRARSSAKRRSACGAW